MKKRLLIQVFLSSLAMLACLVTGTSYLDAPSQDSDHRVPLYSEGTHLDVSESDAESFLSDELGYDLSFESTYDFSWTEDAGTSVQSELDETMADSNWRLEDDWQSSFTGNFNAVSSVWRIGDQIALLMYIDNLTGDETNDLNRRYGISLESGSTLLVTLVIDNSQSN